MSLRPVILSGGAGTRLWPLSRQYYPKPLLRLMGDQSLLQDTVCRLEGLSGGVGSPVVVCNEEHRFLMAEQLRDCGHEPDVILLEPAGRNTAPALTLAALHLSEHDPDCVMLVMPADHVMADPACFREALEHGAALAREGFLVTLGVKPTRPETGFGYIKAGAMISAGPGRAIEAFREKPDEAVATEYLRDGGYLWNSGIFIMTPGRWLKDIEHWQPAIATACRNAWQAGESDARFFRVASATFEACPSDSIDYAVMEKTDRVAVVPFDAGWSDVGAWSAVWEASAQDASGNVTRGDVLLHESGDNLLIANDRCVAAVGVNGLVIVETADAVLVADKRNTQAVREVVRLLDSEGREEHKLHRRVYRPWGYFENVDEGERFKVKRLCVNPGASLSLQKHSQRAEHWVVVRGEAEVQRGDEVFRLGENESTYIPLGVLHRLSNPGSEPVEIVEVQTGGYLGEDDIERFEDVYNRS